MRRQGLKQNLIVLCKFNIKMDVNLTSNGRQNNNSSRQTTHTKQGDFKIWLFNPKKTLLNKKKYLFVFFEIRDIEKLLIFGFKFWALGFGIFILLSS